MIDPDLVDQYLLDIAERFDVYDLVELLGLETEDFIQRFTDELITSAAIRDALTGR